MKRYALLLMTLTMLVVTACLKDAIKEETSKSQSSFTAQDQTEDQEVVKEKEPNISSASKHEDAKASENKTKATEMPKQEIELKKQESKENVKSPESNENDQDTLQTESEKKDCKGSVESNKSNEGSSIKPIETPVTHPEKSEEKPVVTEKPVDTPEPTPEPTPEQTPTPTPVPTPESTPVPPAPEVTPETGEQPPQEPSAPSVPEVTAGFDAGMASELVALVNAEREARGIGTVSVKDSLVAKAEEKALNGSSGSGVISCRGTGATSAAIVVESWKKDWPDGTWMTANWKYVGIACYVDGSTYTWVAVFGAY